MNQTNDFCFNNIMRTPSEFSPGGYDVACISEAMDNTISTVFKYYSCSQKQDYSYSDVFYDVVSVFNEEFIEKLDEASFSTIRKDAYDGAHKLKQLIIFDELLSDNKKYHTNYGKTLWDNYNAVIKHFSTERCFYNDALANNYLESFFELSRNVVFCPNSINIKSTSFRKSKFLQTLISFASKKITCDIENKNIKLENEYTIPRTSFSCYEVSFFDPFAYDTISRTLAGAVRFIIDELSSLSKSSEELFALRKNIFVCSFESAFQRVFTLDSQSFRVELNRHTSKLIAYPVDRLSSISDTKTIRLFEKTAAYIRRYFIQDNKGEKDFFDFKNNHEIYVTLIGHSEISRGKYESSMTDYLEAVLHWYDSLKIPQKPKLELRVKNIFNESGKPDILDGESYLLPEKRETIRRDCNVHNAECLFITKDFELTFTYGLKNIRTLIDKSDLLFILDCPWISTENYSIAKEESLNDYCYRLKKIRWKRPSVDNISLFDPNSIFTDSPMVELNGQYNRIMSSTSLSSGTVVRSMRDDLIKEMQLYINNSHCDSELRPKELYIFSSENEGVDYSYIKSYPLTRLEQYDGKHFTIIKFTNKKLRMLPCRTSRKEKIRFEIDVWSILKYLCFSFAYRYPVNILLNIYDSAKDAPFDNLWLNEPIKYLEMMQNIFVVFDLSNSFRRIKISLGFSDLFDELVKTLDPDSNMNCNGVYDRIMLKKEIGKKILKLIQPLYNDAVFSKSEHYGDDAIKLGFKMTLYSAARDVNTMLFYHLYEEACNKDDFSFFKVIFYSFDNVEHNFQIRHRDYSESSFFADKKLYCTLFNSLERDYRLYMGMVEMLIESEAIYDLDKSYLTTDNRFIDKFEDMLFDNIEKVCNRAKLDDKVMFRNLLRARYTVNP